MKKIITLLFIMLPACLLIFCTASTSKKESDSGASKKMATKNDVSVLELFTSQGCSSCPPADRLLGKYTNRENVIALSFHVDYWDRLGWKDPFSSADFSERQKEYAKIFRLDGVYTPELVINGEKEMVGSDEEKITNSLNHKAADESNAGITFNEIVTGNNTVTVNYTVKGNEANSLLNFALVQNKVSTPVRAGENNGATLTNYNVVRRFKTMPSANAGTNTFSIDLVPGVDKKDFSIVAFLQNSSTYKIAAAAKSAL